MQLTIARFVNTIVVGLLAGLSLTAQCGIVPGMEKLNAASQVLLMQQIIPSLTAVAKPLMILGVISFLILLVRQHDKYDASWWWLAAAFILFITGGLLTILGNFPINEQIMQWQAQNPPRTWQNLHAQWNNYNLERFLAAQASFVCCLIGILFYK